MKIGCPEEILQRDAQNFVFLRLVFCKLVELKQSG